MELRQEFPLIIEILGKAIKIWKRLYNQILAIQIIS